MEEESGYLHAVMLPWLAMGHLLPFFELSKQLALKGHRISFLASPGNLRRLPPVPPSLSQLIELIPCPLPSINNLPPHVESTVDLPSDEVRPFLTQAFLSFEQHLADFLNDSSRPKPDWIFYDIFSNTYVPTLAAHHGVGCALFSLLNAAVLSFFGHYTGYDLPEELMVVPKWINLPTTVVFRPFEARQVFSFMPKKSSTDVTDKRVVRRGNFMAVRTCREFEPEWIEFLQKFHDGLPIIPVGFLPPTIDGDERGETWQRIAQWLNKREIGSVVFVAFGSEVKLTKEQIEEIAVGLELSELAFVWALRAGSPPDGFEGRVGERGLLVEGWVPQALLLGHSSVGGFLTHGGWNSIVEGLTAGVAFVVLPMQFEQGLNARHLEERGIGVEVVRDYEDGSFTGEAIASKLRLAMASADGEGLRQRARKGKEIFGGEKLQDRYVVELVKYLKENKIQSKTPNSSKEIDLCRGWQIGEIMYTIGGMSTVIGDRPLQRMADRRGYVYHRQNVAGDRR